jgi:hypothetical protein
MGRKHALFVDSELRGSLQALSIQYSIGIQYVQNNGTAIQLMNCMVHRNPSYAAASGDDQDASSLRKLVIWFGLG